MGSEGISDGIIAPQIDPINLQGRSPHNHVIEIYKDYDLYEAAINGNLDDFKTILDRVSAADFAVSVDILSRLSPTGNTLLHVAAKHGNKHIVDFIASKKLSFVLAQNFNGETALHIAAKGGDASMVRALVQIHREILSHDEREESDLLMAENEMGNTALHEALFSGWYSIARYLIHEYPLLSYYLNRKGESAIYLAAKAGLVDCVSLILASCTDDQSFLNELFNKKKSPIRAAIKMKHRDVLEAIFDKKPTLIQMRDDKGRTPLHIAASLGYLEGAHYLLNKDASAATQTDKNGSFPIHLASIKGHIDIISLLLQAFPYVDELVDKDGSNILHLASKNGRSNVFNIVLKHPNLKQMINMKDKSGNTPLHLATMHWHPKIVNALTWIKNVDIRIVNNDGMTALDVAEHYMSDRPSFRQSLTWTALKGAGTPRHLSRRNRVAGGLESLDLYKEIVNTLLLVATLVATATFAAGFTMPGGYISSETSTDLGMATMLRHKAFHVFVFCDAVAMYSSITVATALLWAQLGDLTLDIKAIILTVPLIGVALSMMVMAFTAGVFVVVTKLRWLSTTILAIGISFVAILLLFLLPLCIPLAPRNPILRYLAYYVFYLFVLASNS